VNRAQAAVVVVASWDMKAGKEISIRLNVKSSYAASGIGDLKRVPTVLITPLVT